MFKKTTLSNGLRIITAPQKETNAVTVVVLIATGSKYETKDENGISHFVEHMFGKGTRKRPNQTEIAKAIEQIGGRFNFGTSKENTIYWAKVHFRHLDLALDWLSDIILNSKFGKKEIEKEKNVIIQEINTYLDEPKVYVWDLWEKLLYGDQSAGRGILGKKENIKKFEKKQFLDYLKNQYSTKNTVVCVAGKINPKFVEAKVKRYFQGLTKAQPRQKPKVIENQRAPRALLHFKKTDQSHLWLGARAFSLFHSLRYAQELLAIILGGNVSSRLFRAARTKAGLAYYIYTDSGAYTDAGYLVTGTGVAHNSVPEVINLILKEYKTLKAKKVKPQELQRAKDYLKGGMSLSLESSDTQALFYGLQEVFEKKILTPEEVFAKIDEVSPEHILELSKAIFVPEKLNLALIGPFKDKTKFNKLLKI